jgi:hypothetical protein
MEGKIAVVATGVAASSPDRQRLAPRRYIATFEQAERRGALTYAAVDALGATARPQQVVLGDGAAWIKTQADWHFPDAIKILNWAHLERSVHQAIRTACPGKERQAERYALYQTIDGQLWGGAVDAALLQPPSLAAARAPGADQRAGGGDHVGGPSARVDRQRRGVGGGGVADRERGRRARGGSGD